jgi:hypothetical protein
MKRPYVNFRELKAAVPIRSVLERYGFLESLRERGESLSGACPLCRGETSFRASLEKNCFHCFRCEAGGNMLDLVAAVEDRSVRDAAVMVAEWFGVATSAPGKPKPARTGRRTEQSAKPPDTAESQTPPKQEATMPSEPSPPPLQPVAEEGREPAGNGNKPLTFELKLDPDHPWLAGAGLLPETVSEFGLGFCSRGMMAGRICFPIRNASGELLGYAGRWPGDDPPGDQPLWRYPQGLDLSRLVYPAERLAETPVGEELLATDPLRVVLCRQMGLEDVFFVSGGEGLPECLCALLKARA